MSEETPISELVELNETYGFQIESAELKTVPEYQGDGTRDVIKIKALLLNPDGSFTENPAYDNEPFVAYLGDIGKVKKLVSTYKGTTKETNLYKLLVALGLDPDPELTWEEINPAALKGMYGRGDVSSKDNKWLKINIPTLKPLKNKDHLAANLKRRDQVFTSAV